MVLIWTYTAVGLLALAVLLFATAVWMHGRVLGRISAVERDHLRYQTQVEQLDTRITREVKTRAGLARAEAAEDERTILQQSEAILREQSPSVVALERPKRRYRGK